MRLSVFNRQPVVASRNALVVKRKANTAYLPDIWKKGNRALKGFHKLVIYLKSPGVVCAIGVVLCGDSKCLSLLAPLRKEVNMVQNSWNTGRDAHFLCFLSFRSPYLKARLPILHARVAAFCLHLKPSLLKDSRLVVPSMFAISAALSRNSTSTTRPEESNFEVP